MKPFSKLIGALKSLEGLWMGDAFGGSFFWKPEVDELIENRQLVPGPWSYSDDTAQAHAVTKCLRNEGRIVPDILAKFLAEEYEREPHRGYGTMAHTILHQISQGVPWSTAAGEAFDGGGSFGNGAAMRAGPIGAYFSHDLERTAKEAELSARVTHAHPEGQAGAVAVAVAAALAASATFLDGPALLQQVLDYTPQSEVRDGLEKAANFPLERKPTEAASLLGAGEKITAQDTVPFSLWCAARHLDSFPEALWATASGRGDFDTNCAIVGSIVFLRAGEGIPEEWCYRAEEPKYDASTVFEIGRELAAEGQTDRAFLYFRKARELDPKDWRVHLALGQHHFAKREFKEGLGHYQELTRLAPDEAGPGFRDRAEMLWKEGKRGHARQCFLMAAHCFHDKKDKESLDAVCRRVEELGLEPIRDEF